MKLIKYAAQIAYIGTNYAGWQRQNDAIGVQYVLETALAEISSVPSGVIGAGRTDAGVHSVGQVASFRLDREWEEDRLLLAVNYYLPQDVRVMHIWRIDDDEFNARRNALWREYRYFVWHSKSCLPHLKDMVWWVKFPWDYNKIRYACCMLEGRHDFRAFCKTGECPDDSFRTITRVKYKRLGNLSMLIVRAPSFLTNMVRIIVGNLDRIGQGKESLAWLDSRLQGDTRMSSAMTAPACGLYFWKVAYKNFTSGLLRQNWQTDSVLNERPEDDGADR